MFEKFNTTTDNFCILVVFIEYLPKESKYQKIPYDKNCKGMPNGHFLFEIFFHIYPRSLTTGVVIFFYTTNNNAFAVFTECFLKESTYRKHPYDKNRRGFYKEQLSFETFPRKSRDSRDASISGAFLIKSFVPKRIKRLKPSYLGQGFNKRTG